MRTRQKIGYLLAVAFVGSIVLANYLTTRYGFIPVGFGVTASAGTFAAGFALAFRDGVQDALGRWAVVGVIALGALVSFLVSDPRIAIASAVAVLISEMADLAVYTPLRERARFGGPQWATAVMASGIVGAVLDTVVFLSLAFGVAAVAGAITGQLLGKLWATLVFLALGATAARATA